MSMYVCKYLCSYIHTYIHTYSVHVHTYTYIDTYIHTYIHTCTHTQTHNTYIHTYIHIYIQVEYTLVHFDDKNQATRLNLDGPKILTILRQPEIDNPEYVIMSNNGNIKLLIFFMCNIRVGEKIKVAPVI